MPRLRIMQKGEEDEGGGGGMVEVVVIVVAIVAGLVTVVVVVVVEARARQMPGYYLGSLKIYHLFSHRYCCKCRDLAGLASTVSERCAGGEAVSIGAVENTTARRRGLNIDRDDLYQQVCRSINWAPIGPFRT